MPTLAELASSSNWEPGSVQAPAAEPSLLATMASSSNWETHGPQLLAQQRLGAARNEEALSGPPEDINDLSQLLQRANPLGLPQFLATQRYQGAMERINAGQAAEGDYTTAARYEQIQRDTAKRHESFGGELVDAALQAPTMLFEGMLAGRLVGGLFRGAQAARVATMPATLGSAISAAPGAVARAAVHTPLMPSFWLPAAAQNALADGGEWYNAKNLAPAYFHGVVSVAVLGSIGKAMHDYPGLGLGAALTRMVGAGAIGVGEQAVADTISGYMRWNTGYGVLGDLAEGHAGKAMQHAAVQFLTFAAFRGLHETEGRNPLREQFLNLTRDMRRAGLSANEAARRMMAVEDAVRTAPDREGGLEAILDFPEGPLREFGRALAETRPAQQAAQGPTPGEDVYGGNVGTGTAMVPYRGGALVPRRPVLEGEILPAETSAQAQVVEPRQRLLTGPEPRPLVETGQAPAEPPPTVPTAQPERRTSAPMSPEQAASALAQEQVRMQVEGRNAARRPESEVARGLPPDAVATQVLQRARETPRPEQAGEPKTLNLEEFMTGDPELRAARDAWRAEMAAKPGGGYERPEETAARLAKEPSRPPELTEVEAYVLDRRRAGISQPEIGKSPEFIRLNGQAVGRERIRQIEAKALKKQNDIESIAKQNLRRGLATAAEAGMIGDTGERGKVREGKDNRTQFEKKADAVADKFLKEHQAEDLSGAADAAFDTKGLLSKAEEAVAKGQDPFRAAAEAYPDLVRELGGSGFKELMSALLEYKHAEVQFSASHGENPAAIRRTFREVVRSRLKGAGNPPAGEGGAPVREPAGAGPAEVRGAGAEGNVPAAAPAAAGGGEANRGVLSGGGEPVPRGVIDDLVGILQQGNGHALAQYERILTNSPANRKAPGYNYSQAEWRAVLEQARQEAGNVPELTNPSQGDKYAIQAAGRVVGGEVIEQLKSHYEIEHGKTEATKAGYSADAIGEALSAGDGAGQEEGLHQGLRAANEDFARQEAQTGENIQASAGESYVPPGYKPTESDLAFGPEHGDTPGYSGTGGATERPTGGTGGIKPSEIPKNQSILRDFLADESGELFLDRLTEIARNAWNSIKKKLIRTREISDELAGAVAPRTAKLSEPSADAIAQHGSASEYAKRAAPFYIDKILGDMSETEIKLYSDVAMERRLRYAKAAFSREASKAWYEANNLKEGTAKRTELMERWHKLSAMAGNVKTLIGEPDSRLRTEADYQQAEKSPEFVALRERWKSDFVPVMEELYRKAEGLEEGDVIQSLTQMPDMPFNAKAIRRGEEAPEGTVMFGGGRRGNLKNPQARKLDFAREFSGNADGYDTDLRHIIENSLDKSAYLATKAEMYRVHVREGIAQWGIPGHPPEIKGEAGKEMPNVKPPKGTQEAKSGQTSLYYHPEPYPEVRKVLEPDQPWGKIPGANFITKASLLSLVEGAAHSKNLLTFLFKPGVNWINVAQNYYRVLNSHPEVMQKIVELAKIGAMKPEGLEAGVLWGGKTDPTAWMSKALDVLDLTMRVSASDAFDNLVRQGRVVNTERNKRDFINQLGNYNRRTQNSVVSFLRDTGIGPFATAGANYTMQGLRGLLFNPGVTATSTGNALGLRAEMFLKTAAVLSIAPLMNYILWGRVDGDENTPLGAVKVGRGTVRDKRGNVIPRTGYFDLAALTGFTRGARLTGLQAIVEGVRARERPGLILDRAAKDFLGSIAHPAEGPIVGTAHIIATGENMIGMPVARHATGAESQFLLNMQAAMWNANPVISSLSGMDRPERQVPTGERIGRLFGPFGPKFRSTPPGRSFRRGLRTQT